MSNENTSAAAEGQEPDQVPDAIIETPMDKQRAQPKTHFEMMLQAGLNKPELSGSVIGAFMSAEVYFLSREEVTGENKNAQPMMLTNPSGETVVAVFTTLERIPSSYIDMAPYGVKVQGATVVRALENTGFVVNPGDELSFEVPADGVAILREQLLNEKPSE
ncbi:SseB family protein [Glutamicibacter sp. Je.9.36]|uniref:SseB family protein n=1 Tax=Glutamicibacter sp. Je.9.36 TaxID=3142837 RepID=UPI003DA95121